MAFTTVSRVMSIDKGKWTIWGEQSPYFYPEDIAIVMSQQIEGDNNYCHSVACLQCVLVQVQNAPDEEPITSLALMGLWYDPDQKKYRRMDHGEALLALPCGMENHMGGVFREKPTFLKDPNDVNIKVMEGLKYE